ncbi:MAG: efflux RND transporter periplasmic adaptor subunit [Flavobacteriaceae bacterium]|nr:efflux RND transporter periplasmic adaptor subunit [Flavobacteriaceae bacterium]
MKKNIILLTLLVILSSCSDDKSNAVTNSEVIKVTVEQPKGSLGKQFFTASGKIEADQFSNLSTKVTGYVEKVNVKLGDQVKQGQLLLHINNTDIEAQKSQAKAKLIQAEANFSLAENNLKRYRKLYEQKSASEKEFEDIQAAYNIAKAQVDATTELGNEINALLGYSNIKAPFSGVITSVFVKEGDMAMPGTPLIGIENPGKFIATAIIPEMHLSQLKKGQDVKVRIKSNDVSIDGKISEISTSSQNTGGQFLVKVELAKIADTKIYSGMDVITEFPFEGKNLDMVLVPKNVIVNRGQLTGLYTVSQSNTAILRWVRLGRNVGDQVEVLSGLSGSESYIASSEGEIVQRSKNSNK